MGWGDCGKDSRGRNIGYVYEATCDFPGCEEKIDRGLAYACGGMHGEEGVHGEPACEGYFCAKHENNHNCPALLTGYEDALWKIKDLIENCVDDEEELPVEILHIVNEALGEN